MRRDGNVLFYFINNKKKTWKPCDDLRIKSKILSAIKILSKKIEQAYGLCGRGRGWEDLGEWH